MDDVLTIFYYTSTEANSAAPTTTTTGRQRRKGYQDHPGQRDAPRPKRTSEQKQADDARSVAAKEAAQTVKSAEAKAKISKLAALEDQARQNEKSYERDAIRPDLVQATLPQSKLTAKPIVYQSRVDDRGEEVVFNDGSSVAEGPDDDDNGGDSE